MRKAFETPGTNWLCEKHAARIAEIMKENEITILPLPPEYAKEIFENLGASPVPDFYEKVVKM
jgi:predicted CoA-binding protein